MRVEYLGPAEERWGEIAHYPRHLINKYADRLIEMDAPRLVRSSKLSVCDGTSICLSCLLEAGRYDELQELLATRRTKFWSWHRFGSRGSYASAGQVVGITQLVAVVARATLSAVHMGMTSRANSGRPRESSCGKALSHSEACFDTSNSVSITDSVKILIQHGRTDEDTKKGGLDCRKELTRMERPKHRRRRFHIPVRMVRRWIRRFFSDRAFIDTWSRRIEAALGGRTATTQGCAQGLSQRPPGSAACRDLRSTEGFAAARPADRGERR